MFHKSTLQRRLYLYSEESACRVVVGVGEVRVPVVLRLLEVVQHLLVAPARVAVGLPGVIVLLVAANIEHVVEDRGPAHHRPSGPVAPAFNVADASASYKNE